MSIETRIKTMSTEDALEAIAAEMKKPGANLDQLSALIDKVLGTGMKDEDRELVGGWEAGRRR